MIATFDVAHYTEMCERKETELREKLKYLKSDECVASKNTKSTQIFHTNRLLKTVRVIRALMNNDVVDETALTSILQLAQDAIVTPQVEVKEGDTIMELMERYRDVKRFSDKLNKALEKNHLRIDYANNGAIVRA